MITVMGRVKIEELPKFLGMFATRGAAMRRHHGARDAQVLKVCDREDEVVVLFEWSSREAFEGFLADPAVKATMASSGTVGRPEFTFLEPLARFPG
jgi:heme-degrading monooxygenase HmoA